ncbi:Ff.00g048910.m01.CDS01 [Fusarium sp. VM40]|nr:Ff.00g048910.m01.CDS01 [Fusarium sp. VM40]
MGKVASLTSRASKLSLASDTSSRTLGRSRSDPGNISRYQRHPYARFDPDESKRDPIDKRSPEYRRRVRKLLAALDYSHYKLNIKYQTLKAEFITSKEACEQEDWNVFILNPCEPRNDLENLNITGFAPIDFHYCVSPKSELSSRYDLQVLKTELGLIESLIAAGQREYARLRGSDSFIRMRNDWAKSLDDHVDEESIHSQSLSKSHCSRCYESNIIDD